MQASLTDVVNLSASVVTIIGAVATSVGFLRKLLSPTAPGALRADPRAAYPSSASPPGYPPQQPGYPPASYPPQRGYPAPGYPPAAGRAPMGAPPAVMARPRIPHPVLLGFAALALLAVVGYSLVLTFQYIQTGSTDIPKGSPLIALNGVFVAVNLIAGSVAVIALLVASARARLWGWFTFGAIGLLVLLFSLGIFSALALVPACFFALYVYPGPTGR
jgi:hypothetical protein